MLHSIGTPQPDATKLMKYWNNDNIKVCVHAIIDANDGTVYQTLPWDHRAWHAGGKANNTHISVEMCEPPNIKYTSGSNFTCKDPLKAMEYVNRTYKVAVKLFAKLCKDYKLDPLKDGVIISHAEGYKRGVASNHGDPDHLWKQFKMELNINKFRQDVAKAMGLVKNTPKKNPEYKVYVGISNLTIRKGPGTSYDRTGKTTGIGTFTIVETTGSWGKLKSGAGWISLNYTQRV